MAKATLDYFNGSARSAERSLGCGRETVNKGLKEMSSGIRCIDDYKSRGNKKSEGKNPDLKNDIISLAELKTQTDPSLKSRKLYTKMTAKEVSTFLQSEKGYSFENIPCKNTIGNILNRIGYRLKRIQKTKPLKKIKEVDEVFANVNAANKESDSNPESLRISIDSKAHVKLGELSRNGKARDSEAKKALDHDMQTCGQIIPFGILDVLSGLLTIVFGTSSETSDFISDCLELWWNENKKKYPNIRQLVINLDNGPSSASNRTQFIRRIVEFANKTGLEIRLVYYPPYHSKYNPIERCWGSLETHWNGELLDSIDKAVGWAGTMTWKGIKPIVHLLEKVYEKGITLTKKEIKPYLAYITRSLTIPKWDVYVKGQSG